MKAIIVNEIGTTDKLILDTVSEPKTKPNEVKIKIIYAGINFIDIYKRKGIYKLDLPFIPGEEGVGNVIEIGEKVKRFSVGDRVAYCMVGGSYAEFNCVDQNKIKKIPDGLDFKQAASAMLQGLTTHYLTHSTFQIKKGTKVVIQAASGGVGLLLVQVAKMMGAIVVAVSSTEEKMNLIKNMGADYIYSYNDFDKKILSNVGKVDVVYDSVGKTTFTRGLDLLKPRGYMVLYGQSSGMVDSINPSTLVQKGSLFLTRPSLAHYILDPEELQSRADAVFEWIKSNKIKLTIDSVFSLEKAKDAQDRLEKRLNKGKVLLKV
ncbi:MAG: Quinone oxidoreductase 1 [Candidatus Heimdallarchaeota archaeon LC_3]|nr:MAG: Quinone oxidoreductase 1 [Candidatus Heimdallarchaeota archaeon LC_3]